VRYAGTALLCVVAAFGAAFLIRRAVDHGTPTARGTVAADTRTSPPGPSPASSGHTVDAVAVHHRSGTRRLADEFAPGVQRITRKQPKPKHKKHHAVSHSAGSSSPTDATSTPTYTTSTPTYTPTTSQPSPTTSSSSGSSGTGSGGGSSGTTHHSSGSGTGTTSIGG
jgi:hypothetical protein